MTPEQVRTIMQMNADDIGAEGMNLISEIVEIYNLHDFETQVLAASIRSVQDVVDSAKFGADVATIPPKILQSMFLHPLTDKVLKRFLCCLLWMYLIHVLL